MAEVRCACGRRLTDPVSRSRGYGPECWLAVHPELASPSRRRRLALAVPKPRVPAGLIEGQEVLFETEGVSHA